MSNTETFQLSDLTKDRGAIIGQPLPRRTYIKDYTKVTATPEKPFIFTTVMIMEAAEYSWYKHLVGTERLVYLHGGMHPDGTFEIWYNCEYRKISKTKIEVSGTFRKEHLDI